MIRERVDLRDRWMQICEQGWAQSRPRQDVVEFSRLFVNEALEGNEMHGLAQKPTHDFVDRRRIVAAIHGALLKPVFFRTCDALRLILAHLREHVPCLAKLKQ